MKLRDIVLGASLTMFPLAGCDRDFSFVQDKNGNFISFNIDGKYGDYHLSINRKDGKLVDYHASRDNKVYRASITNCKKVTSYKLDSIVDNKVIEEFQKDYDNWIAVIQQTRKEDALKTLRQNPAEAPSEK